jgi:H+/Cl- antiporter ClcA
MAAIGVSVGSLCGVMKCFEELFMEKRMEFLEYLYRGPETNVGVIWAWVTFVALIMAAVSSLLVVYIAPDAAGGGIPEVIGCVPPPRPPPPPAQVTTAAQYLEDAHGTTIADTTAMPTAPTIRA